MLQKNKNKKNLVLLLKRTRGSKSWPGVLRTAPFFQLQSGFFLARARRWLRGCTPIGCRMCFGSRQPRCRRVWGVSMPWPCSRMRELLPPRATPCHPCGHCCNHQDSPDADGNLGATWRCRWLIPARRSKQPRPNQRDSTSGGGRSRRQNCSWKEMKGLGRSVGSPSSLTAACRAPPGCPDACGIASPLQPAALRGWDGLLTPRAGMSQLVHLWVSPPPQGVWHGSRAPLAPAS